VTCALNLRFAVLHLLKLSNRTRLMLQTMSANTLHSIGNVFNFGIPSPLIAAVETGFESQECRDSEQNNSKKEDRRKKRKIEWGDVVQHRMMASTGEQVTRK
jgi:hypothetical protein